MKRGRLLRSSNSRNLPAKIRKSVHLLRSCTFFAAHKGPADLCFAYVASFLLGRQISTANYKQACIVCGCLARCFIKNFHAAFGCSTGHEAPRNFSVLRTFEIPANIRIPDYRPTYSCSCASLKPKIACKVLGGLCALFRLCSAGAS